MANYKEHLKFAADLHSEMRSSLATDAWPVVVDAGYYAVFHGMEAMNATECRNSHSFADAGEILDSILVRQLGSRFGDQYNHLFYFRRGAIYGSHVPTDAQLKRYVEIAEDAYRVVVAGVHEAVKRYQLADAVEVAQ